MLTILDKKRMIDRIRLEMKKTGVTPSILAEEADVTVQAVNQWLSSGKIGLDKFLIISKLLSKSVDWILTGYEAPIYLSDFQKNYSQLSDSWKHKVDDLIQAGLDSQHPQRNLTLYQRGLERVLLALSDKNATPEEIMHYAQVIYQEALANDYADSASNVIEFNQFADKTINRLTA